MGLFLSDAPADVAVVGTTGMLPRIEHAVRALGLPVRAITPDRADTDATAASLYCIESVALPGSVPLPAVLVCTSGPVEREVGVVPITAAGLSPTGLLGAMLDADLQINSRLLRRFVPAIPPRLMAEFLRHPHAFANRQDLCRFLDRSRAQIQALLKQLGCGCPAHFFTRCRAESWILLARRGLKRAMIESYLGIHRRDNFARSCMRASVPVPWGRTASLPPLRPYGGDRVRVEGNAFGRSLSRTGLWVHTS